MAFCSSASMAVVSVLAIRMTEDILRAFWGTTMLINQYFVPEPGKLTFPWCFFHVTKITEQWQNEVSTKRVILYEPQTKEKLHDQLREGVMQSIVDNIVKQPKTYNMDIIVPSFPIAALQRDARQLASIITEFMTMYDIGGDVLLKPSYRTYPFGHPIVAPHAGAWIETMKSEE